MLRGSFILLGLMLAPSLGMGCGLDWTLPQAHFDGVEEHGYVAYWEKIGEADLSDGLVIPVNIGFNSHGEASSPTLGKGWTVALLESHVIPVDENCMNVIMPDGWTFTFLRNGNTETWRGNAGWVGETKNTMFTITAPCGWRVKYDGGKIQEIDSNKNRTLTYKYNGSIATEVDMDAKPFVQIENNPAPGVQTALIIGHERVDLSLAQRPRIQTIKSQNLVTGFDQSLSQLQWPDGKTESFAFGTTDKTLDPTLTITHADQTKRNFTWDARTRQIKTDGEWTYKLIPGDNVALDRANAMGQGEYYSTNPLTGTIISQGIDGIRFFTTKYVNAGALNGKLRTAYAISNGITTLINRCDYDEKGRLIRSYVLMNRPHNFVYAYDERGLESQIMVDGKLWITKRYDNRQRLIEKLFANGSRQSYDYLKDRIRETTITKEGAILKKELSNAFQPLSSMIALTPGIKQK
jgi:hypothetical protein